MAKVKDYIMGTAKYKIIYIIDSLGPGGAERMTFSIINKFDKEKFDIRVCVLQVQHGNPVAKELESIGIPVDLLNIPTLRHPANLPKILYYLYKHRPNLIHTQLEFANIFGNLASFLLQIPSVSTLHTLGNEDKGTAFLRNRLMWLCQKYFCSRIIAVSESTRQHHIFYGKLPHKKILTLYNGIDLQSFGKYTLNDGKERKALLGIPENMTVLLTIAVLRELKGIQYMLKAIPEIVKKAPDIRYLIVGDGPYGETLKSLVESLKIEDYVIFTGQRKDIPELLDICDIFVLPTLTEALPTVLIEACAAQKAIIASNVGGVPEILTEGINGHIIPPADSQSLIHACLNLIQNKVQREAMSIAGLQVAKQKFDIQQQISSLEKLYEGLIENGR